MKTISNLFEELTEARQKGYIAYLIITAPHSGLYQTLVIFNDPPPEKTFLRLVDYIYTQYALDVVNIQYVFSPHKATISFETEKYPKYY